MSTTTTRTPLRGRIGRTAASLLTVAGLAIGSVAVAGPATAVPTCTAGYVCFWTASNGGGSKYPYFSQANHTHDTASVYYNYNVSDISFWTGQNGGGDLITHYTLAQRGFRNWSQSNWNRCRSHRDYY